MAIERLIGDHQTYDEQRRFEYPSLGDMLDALVKKEGGDSTEWDALVTQRETVKAKYPKS